MHDQCCDLGLFWFYASQVICTTRHWPTATSGIVERMGIHAKIMLTPPSAAKIYVFHTELSSNWKLEIIMGSMSKVTMVDHWMASLMKYIPHQYTLLIHQYSEFVRTIAQTNKINKQNELVSAPAKIFNDPKTCYRHVFVHKFSNMCSCQECFFRERVILVITWTNIS